MSGYRTTSKPVTRRCDDCRHFIASSGDHGVVLTCGEGHKPRFFMPQSPNDNDWGWKRACDDYQPLTQSEAER